MNIINKRKLTIAKEALEASQSSVAKEYELSRQRIAQICEEVFEELSNLYDVPVGSLENFIATQKHYDFFIELIDKELDEL